MKFEREPRKAAANLRKHGVAFAEAAAVFEDALSLTGADPDHSLGEHRYIIFGMSVDRRLLAVSLTERGDTIRLLSARLATKAERKIYEEG